MLLADTDDVRRYFDLPAEDGASLTLASNWVRNRTELNGHVPPAVREATALLAAVFAVNPRALDDESEVPNMVRCMLIPWSRPLEYPRTQT